MNFFHQNSRRLSKSCLIKEFSLMKIRGELPQSSIRPALVHTGLHKPKNTEKPVFFAAFSFEMSENHWFLKLWGHLDRDENDFDSFFTTKMHQKSHETRSAHSPGNGNTARRSGPPSTRRGHPELLQRPLRRLIMNFYHHRARRLSKSCLIRSFL